MEKKNSVQLGRWTRSVNEKELKWPAAAAATAAKKNSGMEEDCLEFLNGCCCCCCCCCCCGSHLVSWGPAHLRPLGCRSCCRSCCSFPAIPFPPLGLTCVCLYHLGGHFCRFSSPELFFEAYRVSSPGVPSFVCVPSFPFRFDVGGKRNSFFASFFALGLRCQPLRCPIPHTHTHTQTHSEINMKKKTLGRT